MSSTVSFRMGRLSRSWLGKSVRPRQDLHGMYRNLAGFLANRGIGEMAVARNNWCTGVLDRVHQRAGRALRDLDVLGAEPPRPVDRRAALHGPHPRPRELHELAAPRPHELGAVVTRRVPRD